MLALQVAAGIVLAYIIIVNQKKLLALGGWLLGAFALIVGFGALIWAGSAAYHSVGSFITPELLRKLGTLIGIIPVFMLAGTGIVGMILLGGMVLGKKPKAVLRGLGRVLQMSDPDKSGVGCIVMIGLGFVMVLINYGLSYPLWAFTPVGGWYEAVDAWGRSHGWADGASVLFGALLWQWVWIPLGGYFLIKRLRGHL